MSLGITTVLTMTTISTNIRASLPKIPGNEVYQNKMVLISAPGPYAYVLEFIGNGSNR